MKNQQRTLRPCLTSLEAHHMTLTDQSLTPGTNFRANMLTLSVSSEVGVYRTTVVLKGTVPPFKETDISLLN